MTPALSAGATLGVWPDDALNWAVDGVVGVIADTPAAADEADFRSAGVAWTDALARSVPRRRAEHLAGQRCAVQAQYALGLPAPTAPGRGPGREPLWPAGVVGSLAHGHGVAVAVVGRAALLRGIGVDVERPMDAARAQRLQPRIAPEGLGGVGLRGDPGLALTVAFGAKECLYKALYPTVQSFFGFEAARVEAGAERFDHDHQGSLQLVLTETLSPAVPGLQRGQAYPAQWWLHTDAQGTARVFTRLLWWRAET